MRIVYIDGIDEDRLAATFTYTPVSTPKPVTQPLAPALAHLFNHQTHHRGQVHAMLAGTGVPPPQLDEFFLDWDRHPSAAMGLTP